MLQMIGSTLSVPQGLVLNNVLNLCIVIGRAGRPQFDTCGVAVIMTSPESYAKWNDLSSGRQFVSSKLQEDFVEHLNAEVALGAVQNRAQAVLWFDSTFWGAQTPPERITHVHEFIAAQLEKLGPSPFFRAVRY